MQFESNFECLSFDPFSLQENFMNNECDPDVIFTKIMSQMLKQTIFLMTKAKSSLANFDPKCFLSPSFKH